MLEYKEIKGKIKVLTGLHIGGSKDDIEIGGIDNPVIKDPLTGYPYIPGSSLKGKIRFLLEHKYDKISDNGKPHTCKDSSCEICALFGTTINEREEVSDIFLGRAIFRDAFLTKESKEKLDDYYEQTGSRTEDKIENVIDRKKGTAAHPRHSERVPAGVEFEFSVMFRKFKDTDETNFLPKLEEGLRLLENDSLGGSGSRGYGRIKIEYEIK